MNELITDLENSRSMNLAPIVLRCIDIAAEKTPALPKSYITTPLRLWNYLRVRQTRAFSKSLQAVKVLWEKLRQLCVFEEWFSIQILQINNTVQYWMCNQHFWYEMQKKIQSFLIIFSFVSSTLRPLSEIVLQNLIIRDYSGWTTQGNRRHCTNTNPSPSYPSPDRT